MVGMFVLRLCLCILYFPYLFLRKKAMRREFFVPAGTLIAVKLLSVSQPASRTHKSECYTGAYS